MRLVAGEDAVEDGVAANRVIAGRGVRRHRQDDEHGDEYRRGGAARVDDREQAQAEQRNVQDEDREQQAQSERRMCERDGARCQHDRRGEREKNGCAAVRPNEELAEARHEHRQRRGRHGWSLGAAAGGRPYFRARGRLRSTVGSSSEPRRTPGT